MGKTVGRTSIDLLYDLKKYFKKRTFLEYFLMFCNLLIGYIFIYILKPEWIEPLYTGAFISFIIFVFNSIFVISIDFLFEGKKIFGKSYDPIILHQSSLLLHLIYAIIIILAIKFFILGRVYVSYLSSQAPPEYIFYAIYGTFFVISILIIILKLFIMGTNYLWKKLKT